jgi:hypothetical protein
MVRGGRSGDVVIPGLVPGIHSSTHAGASGTLDPGDPGQFAGAGKSRDDKDYTNG